LTLVVVGGLGGCKWAQVAANGHGGPDFYIVSRLYWNYVCRKSLSKNILECCPIVFVFSMQSATYGIFCIQPYRAFLV
jgi:hypothetical protein